MEESWATFWQVGIPVFTSVITVFAFLANLKKFIPVFKGFLADNIFIIALFKAIISVYWLLLLAIAITIGVTMYIHKFVMVHEQDPDETSPPPSIASTVEPASITVNPTCFLDELQVLNMEPDAAFVFHQWENNFPIKIDNIEYTHSIGARLPVEVEDNLEDNHITERSDYSPRIEYSLGYKYDTFQFSYGIDDNTFKDYGLPPPNCHYWIVVESCICREASEEKSIEIYRTPEVNYMQTIETSDLIDVSKVETLRLTVYWLFDVLPTKPLTLNVAVVDPTLYTRAN